MDLSVVAKETDTKENDIAKIFQKLPEPISQDSLLAEYTRYHDLILHRPQEGSLPHIPWQKANVVYFLMQGGYVAYVGQTTHLAARLATHVNDGKIFDRVSCFEVPREEMLIVEGFNIAYHNPSMNIQIPTSKDLLMMVAKSL